jgi:PAS domain S-box-containing protein
LAEEEEKHANALAEAQAALANSEALLRTILETVPVGIVMGLLPSGRIIEGNTYVERMLRHPVLFSSDIDSYDEWISFHADGTRVSGHEYPFARMMLAGEETPEIEVHYQRGDGTRFWTKIMGRPVRNEAGELVAGVAALLDVDEERRAQAALLAANQDLEQRVADRTAELAATSELFSTAFNHAPIGMALVGLDGRFRQVNPAFAEIVGYSPEELQDLDFQTLTHLADLDADLDLLGQLVAGDISSYRIEKRYLRKGGAEVWVDLAVSKVLNPDGSVRHFIAQVQDLTERRRAEEAAEAASRAQSEFVANVSHELRTPLTAVIGFSELLRAQPELSDVSRRFTSRIGNAGKALLAAVNDILDYSKLEAGEVEFSRKPEVPAQVIANAVEIFSMQAADKSILLTVDGADTLPERLSLDASRLRQILLNLIGNAVKFTQDGEVRVSCSYDKASTILSVSIADTGPGISPEAQGKLFRRFSQVDGASSGGTGLGLAICKALIEAMGGQIAIDSKLGEGATFSFTLPAPVVTSTADEGDIANQGERLAGLRILVTDDQVANREVVAGFLVPYGVELCEAADGQEAVDLAAVSPFDVILMDLRMPVMGGPEATRRIREGQGPNDYTPVLSFSSSLPDPGDAPLFAGSVQKPVTSVNLIDAILAAVDEG